jgi:hypothetical protein
MSSEPKRTINAKQAAADIRSGMTSSDLMQKYQVSAKGLEVLFRKLVDARLLHENELNRQNEDPVRTMHVAWKCPACGAAQTREYAECPQCGVIVAKFQSRHSETGEADRQPESRLSQPSPSSVDAPTGGWAELETGNGRFSHELSAAAQVGTAAAPVTGRPAARSQFPDYQEDDEDGADDESESLIPEPQTLDRSGWIILLVCPIVALVCMAFFWPRWTLDTFKTLVHEMGHAIFGWLFGYPSFPAFDVIWGGGVTIHTGRSTALWILIYVGFAGLFWVYRKNRATLAVLAALVILHAVSALTSIHSVLRLFMGHGTELVIAGLFIYRSLSGRAVIHEVERPLYGIIGFFIVFSDIGMAYKLLTSVYYREDYLSAKGGDIDMDFSVIAHDYLHSDMTSVVIVFFICCLLCLLFSFLAFRYMEYVHSAAAALLVREPKKSLPRQRT